MLKFIWLKEPWEHTVKNWGGGGKKRKENRNHPKTIPVSQELCNDHAIFFSLWKFEWCITIAMNHSSPTETASRLRGSSHKSYEIKVENNHPEWNSDLMDVNLWIEQPMGSSGVMWGKPYDHWIFTEVKIWLLGWFNIDCGDSAPLKHEWSDLSVIVTHYQ